MKNTCKKYKEKGKTYCFSAEKLHMQINKRKHVMNQMGKRTTQNAIIDELAEEMYVTSEAVKNWVYGHNAPSELEQVKTLGNLLNTEYHNLLEEEDKMEERKQKTTMPDWQAQYTKDRVREMYQDMLYYVALCEKHYYEFIKDQDCSPEIWLKDPEYQSKVRDANKQLNTQFGILLSKLDQNYLDFPQELTNDISEILWTEYCDFPEQLADTDFETFFKNPNEYIGPFKGYGDFYDQYFYHDGPFVELKEIFADYRV